MEKWRVVDTGILSAAENMALDKVMLQARSFDIIPNTIRFLQMKSPAVLVGYHQSPSEEARLDYCKRNNIDLNRRITGGGSIYFDEGQLGWELIVKDNSRAASLIFRDYINGVVRGLQILGINAAFRPRNDIEVNGKKISGMGGCSEEDTYLFQGTLLINPDIEKMMYALKIPVEKLSKKEIDSISDRVTSVSGEMENAPDLQRIKEAILLGLKDELNISLKFEDCLSKYEQALLEEKLPCFNSVNWIYNKETGNSKGFIKASRHSKGGTLNVLLNINISSQLIEKAVFTGDFFSYPYTSLYNLESAITKVYIDESYRAIERFFSTNKPLFPGLSMKDFQDVVKKAVNKLAYMEIGVPIEEIGSIMEVIKGHNQITKYTNILIPYCAKKDDCLKRYSKGCDLCCKCEVGHLYKLAKEKGIRCETIINFQDLRAALKRIKDNKPDSAFIGSCCYHFFKRHEDDFVRAGVPGILIETDNQSCFDLNLVKNARDGNYSGKTEIKSDLLKMLLLHKVNNVN